ncbi:MFS transporter [Peziza echinospora]|nr:MFS transporter [Peziza echinospora]
MPRTSSLRDRVESSPSSTTTYLDTSAGVAQEKSTYATDGTEKEDYQIKDIEGGNNGIDQAHAHDGGFIPPDGGLQAWLCVFGAFICQFCSFGFLNACGVFQYQYSLYILPDHSSSSITWITTTQIFLMLMLGGIMGKLADMFGPRKVLIPSAIMVVGGICALSAGTKYWHFILSQGIVYGIGASGLFLPAMITASNWFERKRGLATGIVSSGSSLGGVVFPIMATGLIDKVGFAAAVRWMALFVGSILFIAMLVIRAPCPPKGRPKKVEKTDEEVPKGPGRLEPLKYPVWILFTIGCFCIFWGLLAPINYLPLMARKAGFKPDLARYIISITNAVSIPGRILPAHLSDKYGQFNVMTCIATVSGLSVLAMWLPLELSEHPSHTGIIIFAALYGLASGGFISMMTPCLISMEKGRKMETLALRMGGFMVFMAFASLTGLPIQGALLDQGDGGFVGLMGFSGTTMLVGGLFVASARMIKGDWKLLAKV